MKNHVRAGLRVAALLCVAVGFQCAWRAPERSAEPLADWSQPQPHVYRYDTDTFAVICQWLPAGTLSWRFENKNAEPLEINLNASRLRPCESVSGPTVTLWGAPRPPEPPWPPLRVPSSGFANVDYPILSRSPVVAWFNHPQTLNRICLEIRMQSGDRVFELIQPFPRIEGVP